jgi:molybdopterin molybdotransferase
LAELAVRATVRDGDARAMPWTQARRAAGAAGAPLPVLTRPLAHAAGHALAAPLTALTDLPAFDTSAMDGWAVSGPGPWTVAPRGIVAGEVPASLAAGTARRIATGAPLPAGATAVLRLEDGRLDGDVLRSTVALPPGRDIRPRGQECAAGMTLIEAGATVTPALLALAAAAGHDELRVHRQPGVRLLVTGGELARSGIPRDGRVRDALTPLLIPWLEACGARLDGWRLLGDEAGLLEKEIRDCPADVIITTGATSVGPTDLLHSALHEAAARLIVDSVAVRPGHPMLLAELAPAGYPAGPSGGGRPGGPGRGDHVPGEHLRGGSRRWLVGLPGNPLAAIAGLATLAQPLLRRLGGHPRPATRTLVLDEAIEGHPRDVRLLPALAEDTRAVPLPFDGPAMLRGVAAADVLVVVPRGGVPAGGRAPVLPLTPGR